MTWCLTHLHGFCAYTACSTENKLDQSYGDEKLKKFCAEILEIYEKNDVNGPIGNNSSYFRSDGIGTHDNLKYVDDLSKRVDFTTNQAIFFVHWQAKINKMSKACVPCRKCSICVRKLANKWKSFWGKLKCSD
ncbi:MAG: hypothetical protein Pg6B_10490 [Candidatus Azobacteroides pseudotrichonymphae]|nr:MAG: hypothetical protein Pg6B_10490 [Candidatus Azobacteroides pseudotrichonymphae]